MRFDIFRWNQELIAILKKNEQGTGRYGNTFHADLTSRCRLPLDVLNAVSTWHWHFVGTFPGEEFESMYLGFKPSLAGAVKLTEAKIPRSLAIPASFDWRTKNAVTEVKNQVS